MKRRLDSLPPRRLSAPPPRSIPKPRHSRRPAPAVLRGFEQIERLWDREAKIHGARILPGEYYVTQSNEVIVTLLGSCVSACIRDPHTGLGGMNHFMLPVGSSEELRVGDPHSESARYGNFAMEKLLNELLSRGARRQDLEIKIVGGGSMWASKTDIGRQNISFVRAYLKLENLMILGEHVGGSHARRVHYFPATGVVRVKKIGGTQETQVARQEISYRNALASTKVEGEVDLFG